MWKISIITAIILHLSSQSVMSLTVKSITPVYHLGEGPHWDAESQKLYYVDINSQKILRLDPATGKITTAYLKDGPVGVAVPVQGTNDQLIVGYGQDIVLVTWDGENDTNNPPIKKLASLDTDRNNTRINDGKCDPAGRFWAGTMANEIGGVIEPNRGSLYKIDKDLKLEKLFSPVSISNGLIWNSQNDQFYYIDSATRKILAYDYNITDGALSNKRVVFDLEKNNISGVADGMTRDTDDNLWIALYNGGAVIQVNPKNGELLQTVKLPVDKITSVAFGGPDMDILYVTTAYNGMSDDERKNKPSSGSLFTIEGLGVHGPVANKFIKN